MSYENNQGIMKRLHDYFPTSRRDIYPSEMTSVEKFKNKCEIFLNSLKQNGDYILRKDDIYYYINKNHIHIQGTKEEIEQFVGSKYNEIIEIVSKYKESYKNRLEITTFIPNSYIKIIDKKVFIPNNPNKIMFQDEKTIINLFNYNRYLSKRLDEPIQNIEQKEESLISKVLSIATTLNSTYIKILLSKFFINFERKAYILTLIGNQEFTKDIFFKEIIIEIFGYDYCLILSEEILKNQSLEDILKNKLFFFINYIPEDKELLEKLETIIKSVFLQEFITSDKKKIKVISRIIISLNVNHPFLKKYVESSKIFFINSTDYIFEELNYLCRKDKLLFLYYIKKSLNQFVDELNYFGRKVYDIETFETNNKEFLEQIDNNLVKEIVSNQNELLNINNLEKFIPIVIRKHTYIIGQSGSGKSEILKTICLSDINKNDSSIIVVEPHGDLSIELAKKINDINRLIFINPTLESSKTPTINLFDLKDKSESNVIQTSKMIISILKDVNDDEKFSGTMSDVLENCIPVLLRKENSNFKELYRFMNDKRNKDLIELGKSSINDLEKEYFEDKFLDSSLTVTKEAVARRLKKLLNDELFSNLMNGKSTINLEQEINTKGRIIIFRIPKSSMLDSYKYYARFIIGLIQIVALKRANLEERDRIHTHLFIDEFHNFITPTIEEILTESRKYKLFLTLAHQSVSQIKDNKLKDIILSNTSVKIIGKNSNNTFDALNKTLNEKLTNIENLEVGEFFIKAGNQPLIKIQNSDEYIGDKNTISDEKWEETKNVQIEKYYRDIKQKQFNKPTEDEINKMIEKFKQDIKSMNLTEESCFYKLKENASIRFEEIKSDFEYLDKDGNKKPRIRKQEINIVFALAFNLENFIDNRDFIPKLKSNNDSTCIFNQDYNGSRNGNYTDNGKVKTEYYYHIDSNNKMF
ncbi:MAG: type IV secretory system conjugative DNA transfer family protein [Arcobacter sp.]|uniref:type IV secretory system conjugative DNA transfer family protein n=1 Tax=Arcobacter sp. TaxID=1872629 RepID=UPI003D064849